MSGAELKYQPEANNQLDLPDKIEPVELEDEQTDPGATDEEQNDESTLKDQGDFKPYTSRFLNDIGALIERRNNIEELQVLDAGMNSETFYINTYYRCLVECLLTFSEMASVQINDLKEVCNAFTLMIKSKTFNDLPNYYPYIKEIINLNKIIRKFCLEADGDQLCAFRLKRETKLKLLATRWELANYVEKVGFEQINFRTMNF